MSHFGVSVSRPRAVPPCVRRQEESRRLPLWDVSGCWRGSRGSFPAGDGDVSELRVPGSHLHQCGSAVKVSRVVCRRNFSPSGIERLKKSREGNNFKFHTQLKMRLIQNYNVRSFMQQNKVISTSSLCPGSLCARRVGPPSSALI